MRALLDRPAESLAFEGVRRPVRFIESPRVPVKVNFSVTRPPAKLPEPPRAELAALLICPAARPAVGALAGSAPLVNAPMFGRTLIELWLEHLARSEEHTSELQSRLHLVCRLLLEK